MDTMKLAEAKEQLDAIMRKKYESYSGISRAVLEFICGEQNHEFVIPLLAHMLKHYGVFQPEGETVDHYDVEEKVWARLVAEFGWKVSVLAANLVRNNSQAEEAAARLHEELGRLKSQEERIVFNAMFSFISGITPYRTVPDNAVKMTDEEMSERIGKLEPVIHEIYLTVNSPFFNQRTAKWSTILELIDKLDERDKAVALAMAVAAEKDKDQKELPQPIIFPPLDMMQSIGALFGGLSGQADGRGGDKTAGKKI